MQKFLFLDSSKGVCCGLLEREKEGAWKWLDYKYFPEEKGSTILHALVHQMLEEFDLEADQLEGLILSSGPGSYTGMRLAEGFAQIFEWQGLPVYSFYHYEVPWFVGLSKGVWLSNAFKGEYFIYQWDKDSSQDSLVTKEQLLTKINSVENIFFQSEALLDLSFKFERTSVHLIKSRPSEVFERVFKEKIRRTPYYYRPIDKEFKKGS